MFQNVAYRLTVYKTGASGDANKYFHPLCTTADVNFIDKKFQRWNRFNVKQIKSSPELTFIQNATQITKMFE